MTDPASDPRAPGERRLAHPPSDRYRAPEAAEANGGDAAEATGRAGSRVRGVAFGTIAALGGAVATVILGGAFAVSAGLIVVAAATGYAVGLAVTAGTGTVAASGATGGRGASRWVAIGLAVTGVLVGQVGLWLFARTEGGVLGLPDYLGQTFGPLVPIQVLAGGVAAWWSTR